MAARKKTARRKAAANKNTALALPDEAKLATLRDRFADKVEKDRQAVALGAGGWPRLRTSSRGFIFNEEDMGDSLQVVVLGASFERQYFTTGYDADNITPPTCQAVAFDRNELAPTEKVPEAQSEKCLGCWAAQFGSAESGRGQACRERIRLAVLPALEGHLDASTLASVPGAMLSVPPTSINPRGKQAQTDDGQILFGWGDYAQFVTGTYGLPFFCFLTRVTIIPDAKSQYRVCFSIERPIDPEDELSVLTALETRYDGVREMLGQMFEPTPNEVERSKGPGGKKVTRTSRKAAAGRRKAAGAKKKGSKKKAARKVSRKKAARTGGAPW